MSSVKVPVIDKKEFNSYIESLSDQRRTFIVGYKRSRRTLFLGGNKITRSGSVNRVSDKKVNNLISRVARCVNEYIKKNEFWVDEVRERFPSVYSNRQLFNKLKNNSKFYYLDINHCFWRIAYLNNYINKSLYDYVLDRPELKNKRNMALACIKAPEGREYYKFGKLFNVIEENKWQWATIYDNIRFTSYNLMGDLMMKAKDHCYGYRTDGIMVSKKGLEIITSILDSTAFGYKVINCVKIDNRTYEFGEGEDSIIKNY